MIHEFQSAEKSEAVGRRVVAVVAGAEGRAREVAERFAAAGDEVETRWYANREQLLGQAGRPHFEAVILFPGGDAASADADEDLLRSGMVDTPLFRVCG